MSMLKLAGIGNLGKDAVINQVNGKNVINFNFAHTNKYTNAQGSTVESTQWVECSYWTDKTGITPYLKKGQLVYVEGIPEVTTYLKKDGTTGVSLRLRVGSIQLCGKAQEQPQNSSQGVYVPPAPSLDEKDLPF